MKDFKKAESGIESKIEDFLRLYGEKIDDKYLLYLFRFYNYLEGIKRISKHGKMDQELLSIYIEKKEYNNIIALCCERGNEQKDLWIQAINYFREEDESSRVQECLHYISQSNALSPLMILEVIKNTDTKLEFKYIKDYMLSEIKKLDDNIKESNEETKENMGLIDKFKNEYKSLVSSPKLFESSTWSKCNDLLTVPTFHFLCGHVYHESCVQEDEYKKVCKICHPKIKEVLKTKEIYKEKASDTQQFDNELERDDDKMKVIAHWFGAGLFDDFVEN